MVPTITPPVMLDILRAISAAMADGYEVFGIRNDAVRLPPRRGMPPVTSTIPGRGISGAVGRRLRPERGKSPLSLE